MAVDHGQMTTERHPLRPAHNRSSGARTLAALLAAGLVLVGSGTAISNAATKKTVKKKTTTTKV